MDGCWSRPSSSPGPRDPSHIYEARSRRDNPRRQIICPIHFGSLENPKLLRCNHVACLECLEGIAEERSPIVCSICRRETPVPWEGVMGLPDALQGVPSAVRDRSTSACAADIPPRPPPHRRGSSLHGRLPSSTGVPSDSVPPAPTLYFPLKLSSEQRRLPHKHQETWYIECTRSQSHMLLSDAAEGAFLIRPTESSTDEFHTHTLCLKCRVFLWATHAILHQSALASCAADHQQHSCKYKGVRNIKVLLKENHYGVEKDKCVFDSLMELVLYYNVQPILNCTTLAHPLFT